MKSKVKGFDRSRRYETVVLIDINKKDTHRYQLPALWRPGMLSLLKA